VEEEHKAPPHCCSRTQRAPRPCPSRRPMRAGGPRWQ
jgi:hypothetical protein